MPTKEHKTAYRRIIEAVNAGDSDALDALFTADMVDHNPVPDQVPGLAGFKQWMSTARRSFPDLHGTVGHVLAEGDLVAGRVTWRGTQAGPFAGVAPTGQFVVFGRTTSPASRTGLSRSGGAPPISSERSPSSVLSGPDQACVLSSRVAMSPR
jgi:predicted ester cyclase